MVYAARFYCNLTATTVTVFFFLLYCIYLIIIFISSFLTLFRQWECLYIFCSFQTLFAYNKCETAYIVHLMVYKA